MATRGKSTSRRGKKRATAASSTRAADTEVQGLIPVMASALAEPAEASPNQAVATKTPAARAGTTKLSGLQIEKVLTNLSKIVGSVVQSAQPAVPLPRSCSARSCSPIPARQAIS